MTALAKEIETYDTLLPRLLEESPGRFVLIKGDVLVGTYDDQEQAIMKGYLTFAGQDFLVRQVLETQPVRYLNLWKYGIRQADTTSP